MYFSYSKCDNFIQDFKEGKLQTQPGCSADDTLEVSVTVQQTENIFCCTEPLGSFHETQVAEKSTGRTIS